MMTFIKVKVTIKMPPVKIIVLSSNISKYITFTYIFYICTFTNRMAVTRLYKTYIFFKRIRIILFMSNINSRIFYFQTRCAKYDENALFNYIGRGFIPNDIMYVYILWTSSVEISD